MKKIILLVVALSGVALISKAQCDTKVRYTSSKTEHLDASKTVQETRDETVIVEVTKTGIKITPDENNDESLTGNFKENTCEWKDAFKNGKTVIKTDLNDPHGDPKTATITIEAVDGKITILVEAVEFPDKKMRLLVYKYEEIK